MSEDEFTHRKQRLNFQVDTECHASCAFALRVGFTYDWKMAAVDVKKLGKPEALAQSAFAEALSALIDIALTRNRRAGNDLNSAFTFLLTPKQFDRIRKICKEQGWDVPNQRGILIDHEAVAHPLKSRMGKDLCTAAEVLEILLAAYSPQSQVGLNRPKHTQAIVFNTRRKVRIGNASFYAVAVVKVRIEGPRKYLAPVTAYHATEAKIRNIS